MELDRWKRINELFDAAIELPSEQRAAFLTNRCDGDENLKLEVEKLLAGDEHANSFIEKPALEKIAEAVAKLKLNSVQSKDYKGKIAHYQILKKIGSGGMGEVYLAEDTRLGRKVALKLLPSEFTNNEHRVRRFEQEAKAASALNHPNILTIYDVGQFSSSSFIASEFIDGETLRERLRESSLPLKEVLGVSIQVAEALNAAHGAGIMHRDIKPENIMIRNDGYAKFLILGWQN